MKITKTIINIIFITLLSSAGFTSCKYETNIIDNTVNENNSIVAENGLLVPDAIELIKNYSGIEIPFIKIVVFNQEDVNALANVIKDKSIPISIDLSSSNIETIGGFSDCIFLKKIILPDSIKTIESNAFNGCTSLSNIKMPYYLTDIKDNAFYNCPELKSIKINDLVKTIGMNVISEYSPYSFKFDINNDNNSWDVKSVNNFISLNYENYIAHKDETWTRF